MSIKGVYTYAKWQVKEGNLDIVATILNEVVQKSSEETGNLFYNVYQSNSDKNTIILYEGYVDETAVEAHRNSEHFKQLVLYKIIPLLENREVILMSQLF